jgi:hypothetical protein
MSEKKERKIIAKVREALDLPLIPDLTNIVTDYAKIPGDKKFIYDFFHGKLHGDKQSEIGRFIRRNIHKDENKWRIYENSDLKGHPILQKRFKTLKGAQKQLLKILYEHGHYNPYTYQVYIHHPYSSK